MAKFSLHFDGLMVFLAALALYFGLGHNWVLFVALILVPDIFMLGYLFNSRFGSKVYNLGHSMIWPVLLGLGGWFLARSLPTAIGLIWLAHIGLDHAVGYGYKYEDNFKHTHFSEV